MGLLYASFGAQIGLSSINKCELNSIADGFIWREKVIMQPNRYLHFESHGVETLASIIESIGYRSVVLVASELGSINFTLIALSRLGVKLAIPFYSLSPSHKFAADVCKARLIDLNSVGSSFQLLSTMQDLSRTGLVPLLMLDVPSRTKKKSRFLGYDVMASRLCELYSKSTASQMILVWNKVDTRGNIQIICRAPGSAGDVTTRGLLRILEDEIYSDPLAYSWAGARLLFSDVKAIGNGIQHLREIVDWRSDYINKAFY